MAEKKWGGPCLYKWVFGQRTKIKNGKEEKWGGSARVGVNNEREMRKNGAKKMGKKKNLCGFPAMGSMRGRGDDCVPSWCTLILVP